MLDSGSDALSRKASAARLAREAEGMSVGKAFRRALARGAETLWNLALVARDMPARALDQRAAEAQLAEFDLLMLLEGPEDKIGFAAVDRQTLTALIEVRTMGVIEDHPPETRPLTGTDAAICAPLIDDALRRLAASLAEAYDGAPYQGFRYGARIEEARIAGTLMTAPRYHRLRADVELGGGVRQGRILFLLPDDAAPAGEPATDGTPGPHADFMLGLPVQCTAILSRIEMPAAEFEALTVGSTLELPGNPLSGAELRVGRRTFVSRAVLGQRNGRRALRLTDRIRGGDATATTDLASVSGTATALAPSGPPATEIPVPAPSPSGAGHRTSSGAGHMPMRVENEVLPDISDLVGGS